MSRRRMRWIQASLVSFICLWSAALVLQNVAIIFALKAGSAPYPTQMKMMFVMATAKAIVIALTLFYFLRQPRRRSAVIFSVAILYAFPLGLFIDPTFRPDGQGGDPKLLITLSALLSYATVAATAALEVLRERARASEHEDHLAEE